MRRRCASPLRASPWPMEAEGACATGGLHNARQAHVLLLNEAAGRWRPWQMWPKANAGVREL